MLERLAPIGIYGGTFDPIHHGHLRSALELYEDLNLDHVRLIPARTPVHRPPTLASAKDRLAMVELAVQGQKAFVVDRCEIDRQTSSYTYFTLLSLREALPRHPLCLMIGVDAFCDFDTWYEWEKILELAHIVCVNRPQFTFQRIKKKTQLYDFVQEKRVGHFSALQNSQNGLFYLAQTTPLGINATDIRTRLAQGKKIDYLLPENVMSYILKHRLYHSN